MRGAGAPEIGEEEAAERAGEDHDGGGKGSLAREGGRGRGRGRGGKEASREGIGEREGKDEGAVNVGGGRWRGALSAN